jgi:hypothetical protein
MVVHKSRQDAQAREVAMVMIVSKRVFSRRGSKEEAVRDAE